jgi:hypothetical protein
VNGSVLLGLVAVVPRTPLDGVLVVADGAVLLLAGPIFGVELLLAPRTPVTGAAGALLLAVVPAVDELLVDELLVVELLTVLLFVVLLFTVELLVVELFVVELLVVLLDEVFDDVDDDVSATQWPLVSMC